MKITIPTNRSWQVSYFGDLFSNVVDTFNVDFHYSEGKIRTGQYFYPHTSTDDIAGIHISTDFVLSNADNLIGTLKYWSANEVLYKQTVPGIQTTPFVADSLTLSPSALVDSDIVNWGITSGYTLSGTLPNQSPNGIDILVASTPTDLALLDYFANTPNSFTWVQHWWTSDLEDTFSTSISATPSVQLVVASTAAYHNGDIIEVYNSGTQYATFSGNVTTIAGNTLLSGLTTAEVQTMGVGATISGTYIAANTVISAITSSGVVISIPATGNGTNFLTWSDGVPRTLDGVYTISIADGTHINLLGLSGTNQYGTTLGLSFSGNIARLFNNSTKVNYLGQLPMYSGPHILLPFGIAPVLFITDKNAVHSIGSPGAYGNQTTYADVQNSRLVFKPGYSINWACATSLKIYFGLSNDRDLNYPSLVEEYDPFNEQIREIVVQNGATIGFLVDNNVHVVDYKGNLKSYNGSTFDVYAQFPVAEIDGTFLALPHRNGIFVSENRINMLIPPNSFYYGGWWTYEMDNKRLYHQGSPVSTKGAQVTFGSSYQDLYGAFFPTTVLDEYLAGVTTEKVPGTPQTGIFSVQLFLGTYNQPIGRIILGKIPSSDIDSVWRNVLLKYNPVLDRQGLQNGTLVLKYKTQDYPHPSFGLSGTWISATEFSMVSTANIVLGAEVIVTSGQASGASFNVVSIAATSVVITNENIGFVPTGNFEFNIDNFERLPQTQDVTDNTKNYGLLDITNVATNEWIQFEIELRGLFSLEEVQVGVEQNLEIEAS